MCAFHSSVSFGTIADEEQSLTDEMFEESLTDEIFEVFFLAFDVGF